jgi:hypothetical protein
MNNHYQVKNQDLCYKNEFNWMITSDLIPTWNSHRYRKNQQQ